ncbi:transglutaminase-like putative cysteine protease [Ancylobacter sp. 3268]|uniref:transglutaminase-like domain-containing protein n=1 Tax=Ancylobacter sp. 3268 TaxID=2817752 RepID=UPI00285ED810|nr:transglutaminase family protein [Ancylobacter sp. 3268]MDR6951905.1 transglutaminase-like putative cysteine protease [Ancylobacter sp. 3268]
MQFNVSSRLDYEVRSTTVFVLNVEAAALRNQKVLAENLVLEPPLALDRHVANDSGTRFVRVVAEPGTFSVGYNGHIELNMHDADPATVPEVAIAELPLEVAPYLNPSRYCQADLLGRFAQREFGGLPPGHSRVTQICNWIYDHVDYVRGASDAQTSAYDTMVLRAGVCRDFAHLGISFCRALGIPARFASAYAWQLDPPDFHAVFEVYLGDSWYLFDPTRQAALQGLVRIGVGRDAADAAFATIHGDAEMTGMQVSITPADDEAAGEEPTVRAVGIA